MLSRSFDRDMSAISTVVSIARRGCHLLTRRCAGQLDNMMVHGNWPQPALKLADFGFSRQSSRRSGSLDAACNTICGTPEYMAPEVRTQARRHEVSQVLDLSRPANARLQRAARSSAATLG